MVFLFLVQDEHWWWGGGANDILPPALFEGGGELAPVTPPCPMPMHFEDVLIMKHYDLCGNVPSKGSLLIYFHFTFHNHVGYEACQTLSCD